MSSFFTLPASQRKRKRTEGQSKLSSKKKTSRTNDDDSISGSDLSDIDGRGRVGSEEFSEDDEEEYLDEDPAFKRIRLAEQYLANTEREVIEDGGFDAADVDQENLRRRMGERLREDTAESKGKLYRWIGDSLDWRGATSKVLRSKDVSKTYTGVAIHGNHVYAVNKDLHLVKWECPRIAEDAPGRRPRTVWKVVARSRGNRREKHSQNHSGHILCVAVSPDGKFVATGGADKKLIVWDATTLKPLKVFNQHRDAVMALAFRRGTNQLFSASKDRTVKIWSLNELAYVETLFGHQDEVVGVSALAQEKCTTVGARDRTARVWKVVEESQLVFRGGGSGTAKKLEMLEKAYEEDSGIESGDQNYHEGSMDQIAMVDDDTFVTGSDNGSISLWNINKKKAVYTMPLAHGAAPPITLAQASAEQEPDQTLDEKGRGGKQARWITALSAIPFSNIIVSGSWDGCLRAWKITQDKRRIEALGPIGVIDETLHGSLKTARSEVELTGTSGLHAENWRLKGVINDISLAEAGERGKECVLVAAAVGREHRFGRWKDGENGNNHVVLFEVRRKLSPSEPDAVMEDSQNGLLSEGQDFEGFD